jgi:hypothetical protein
MKEQLTESDVLFLCIIKKVFWATIAVEIMGGVNAIFLKLLGHAPASPNLHFKSYCPQNSERSLRMRS